MMGRESVPGSPVLSSSRQRLRWWLRLSAVLNCVAVILLVHYHLADLLGGIGVHPGFQVDVARELVAKQAGEVAVPAAEVAEGASKPCPPPPAPPRQCGLCDVNPALCAELGRDNAHRAFGYMGSHARLRRALAKMRSGQPFNVAVVGGSVSKGYGIRAHHPLVDQANMHRQIFDHLNALFPGKGEPALNDGSHKAEGRNGLVNGALGATGTTYFQHCFAEHIPEDADLVLVEAAINDERLMQSAESYETLVRALLDLPSEPAIINLQMFALVFKEIATGGDMHFGVAEYYDTPTISLRGVFLRDIFDDFTVAKKVFFKVPADNAVDERNHMEGHDMRHVGLWAHSVAANLTNAYIDMQLCEMDALEAGRKHVDIDELYPSQKLPRQKLLSRYDRDTTLPPFRPNCFSMNAQRHKLRPASSNGWKEWAFQEKNYLVAEEPGAKVSVKFTTGLGVVEIFYLRSGVLNLGDADCWVDDDVDRSVEAVGYHGVPVNVGHTKMIRNDLTPGEHVLHCQVKETTHDPAGGTNFRLISVMSV